MSYRIAIVCRPETAAGFALAGLTAEEVASPEEARSRIEALATRPEVGVVLVQDQFYSALPDDLRREFSRRPLPMIVPFPGPSWGERLEGPEAYIAEILRQAIGYRVRLR